MLTPFPLLSRLQINNREKAILIVIFLLLFFVIAFAILRLVETNAEGTTVDPIRLALFSTVEVSCCRFSLQYLSTRALQDLGSYTHSCSHHSRLPTLYSLILHPRSANSSRSQRSYGRRNELLFDSSSRKDTVPLQNFVKTRPPQGRTVSAESILRPEDKIHVRRDFLVSHGDS